MINDLFFRYLLQVYQVYINYINPVRRLFFTYKIKKQTSPDVLLKDV